MMACFLLGALSSQAQSESSRQQADRFFYSRNYSTATERYSELLKDTSLSAEIRKDVLYNLGYAFQQLADYAKAESYFRQLLEQGEPTGKNRTAYLYYAQALAYNGKMAEAEEMYARYEAIYPPLGVVSPSLSASRLCHQPRLLTG